ncbi:MAG TPA: SDR family oxidoreductase [Bellilinea sp.]|jgi:glucose 1-dehydrogenase|nr:SDR family oxidoreductase [Bellilinea sp.]
MSIIERFRLDGKTAIVTGSSRGIGRAIALAFAEQGADVVVNYRDRAEEANEVAAQISNLGQRALLNQADMGKAEEVRNLYSQTIAAFGKVDIIVLNASVQIRKDWAEYTPEELELQMAVNFKATYELTRLAVADMQTRGWGRVLTIGSVQEFKPHPQMLIYAASKNAQTGLMMNLARQSSGSGITFNNLAPGTIITDRTQGVLENTTYRDQVLAAIPARKFGEPQDCAAAALFICSDAGSYVNGVNLLVDGGMHL